MASDIRLDVFSLQLQMKVLVQHVLTPQQRKVLRLTLLGLADEATKLSAGGSDDAQQQKALAERLREDAAQIRVARNRKQARKRKGLKRP